MYRARLGMLIAIGLAVIACQAAAEKRSEYFRIRIPVYGEFYDRYRPLYRIGALANFWNLRTYDLQYRGEPLEGGYYERLRDAALGNGLRLDPSLEAASPLFARLAWGVGDTFLWTHHLHENAFDAYAAPGLTMEQRHEMVEWCTDEYLKNPRALSPNPVSMAFIEALPYSGAFERKYPKMIGLMWAGHWLHGGVYDGLVSTARGEQTPETMTQSVLAEFRAKVQDPPSEHPHFTMISPKFTQLHPRTANIFGNMHMLHDMVADILADNSITDKRRAIYEARDAMRPGGIAEDRTGGSQHHAH